MPYGIPCSYDHEAYHKYGVLKASLTDKNEKQKRNSRPKRHRDRNKLRICPRDLDNLLLSRDFEQHVIYCSPHNKTLHESMARQVLPHHG